MATREATEGTVRDYLLRVYHLKPGVVAEIMEEHADKLKRGRDLMSHADYVGDEIAKAAGLAEHYDDAAWTEYEEQFEEEEDE